MPRNMSFAMTKHQIMEQTKYVTRRIGWWNIKPGEIIQAVEKAMGLKKGEKINKLTLIRVISTRVETLDNINEQDCALEGFSNLTPKQFIDMFCQTHKCKPWTKVNRIAFDYHVQVYSCAFSWCKFCYGRGCTACHGQRKRHGE